MVRSEDFGTLIGRLVNKNKKAVISFMRSQGISVSFNATNNQVIKALFAAFKSKKFREAFMSWTRGISKEGSSNMVHGFSNTNGNFDPMSAQGSGKEFDAMSSQEGADLKGGGFSNASGFDPMNAQNGDFTPVDTQNGANLKGAGFSNVNGEALNQLGQVGNNVNTATSGGGGGFLDGFNIGDTLAILNSGLGLYGQTDTNKTNRDIANAQLENTRLQLEALRAKGEIDKAEFDRRMALANSTASGGGSKTALYIVGGVVLVGALGAAVYFATRKK
jgi:hypothetical protein